MQKKDDKLIEEFLTMNIQEIADNGFSQKVMKRLPKENPLWGRIWTIFGLTLTIFLFLKLNGIQIVLNSLLEPVKDFLQICPDTNIDLTTLAVIMIAVWFIACQKIASWT